MIKEFKNRRCGPCAVKFLRTSDWFDALSHQRYDLVVKMVVFVCYTVKMNHKLIQFFFRQGGGGPPAIYCIVDRKREHSSSIRSTKSYDFRVTFKVDR